MKLNFKFLELMFMGSAAEFDQCLQHDKREIAFVGASNAGKSSAINAISNQKKLAKTSKTPGKTKLFNFLKQSLDILLIFRVTDIQKFQNLKKDWAKATKYFSSRENLIGAVLFTDIRNPMRELDLTMFEMLATYDLPILIVLTKTDKVSKDEAETVYKKINNSFSDF